MDQGPTDHEPSTILTRGPATGDDYQQKGCLFDFLETIGMMGEIEEQALCEDGQKG